MQLAAVLFALAALGGLTLAVIRFTGKPWPPTWMALGHGGVAAVALLTLIYTAATTTLPNLALYALGGFVLTALGGATLFAGFHLRQRPLPIPLVLGHGALALISFGLLVAAIWS